jgi:hypothetical protein
MVTFVRLVIHLVLDRGLARLGTSHGIGGRLKWAQTGRRRIAG